MRPILRQICPYSAIHDPCFSLEDFARMNDALDVQDENERRFYEASK
ncbi:MAG: DUF6889 family protein [Burkholderiales bacterium]